MNNNNSIALPVYLTFKNAGQSSILIFIIGIKFLFAIWNIFLSASLACVILVNKNLFARLFHKLVLYNAFTNCMIMFNPMITFTVVLTGANFIPLLQCFHYQTVPLFFAYCQQMSLLLISLDRLMAALFPFWHMNQNVFYLICFTLLSFVYPIYIMYLSYCYVLLTPEKYVMCSGPDCSPPSTFYWTWAINGSSVASYFLLGIVLKLFRKNSPVEFTRRIFKSLGIIMVCESLGWFLYSGMRILISQVLQPPELETWFIFQYYSWFNTMVLSLYPIVLFYTSKDYQTAYLSTFKCLSRLPWTRQQAQHNQQVQVATTTQINAWVK